uniref:Acyltransferase n=1 Tax=Macrostomum lignano TaxID=282301 RepID=A0A1I8FE38_9PLAT
MSNGFGLSTSGAADLKAPLPLNADAEVGFEKAQQSASLNVDIGAVDVSAQLERGLTLNRSLKPRLRKASQETHTQAERQLPKEQRTEAEIRTKGRAAKVETGRRANAASESSGIEFAPLNTPMRRRLQTLAVLQWLLSITVMPIICVLFIMMTLLTPLAPLSLAYVAWIFFFDCNTAAGRRLERVRRWSLWRHYRDYFPIRLVKSADLDPAHNYLIGYHPHGIISCGGLSATSAPRPPGFSAKFPGIKPYLLTLRINFFWPPCCGGYFMSVGVCDVQQEQPALDSRPRGRRKCAIVVVGGAQEALDARPGNYKLTLLKRKGFAPDGPADGGPPGALLQLRRERPVQAGGQPARVLGSSVPADLQGRPGLLPPFFYGRGVFNYTFGLLPYRHAVTTKCPEPSAEQVDRLHRLYMERLADLFDEFKAEH